jgi:hypothetical protein
MEQLPKEVVVHQILTYLKWTEVSLLLSTSNGIFSEIRYSTMQYCLKIEDIDWSKVEHLLNKINSNEQLRFEGAFSGLERAKWVKVSQIKGCSLRLYGGSDLAMKEFPGSFNATV